MTEKVRRSWLLVPVSSDERVEGAHVAGADAVVLDLAEFVAEEDKPSARDKLAPAIERVRAGGAEVFAQVDPELIYADLRACVWPGLTGVVVARLESPQQVMEVHDLLGRLEEERGLLPGSLEIVASVETAQGNLRAYDIGTASSRLWGMTLGRADLVMDLRPEPSGEIHFMQYLMQRLVIVAGAAGVMPLGAWWRDPDRGLLATPENTYQAALRGRAIGFKGSFCVLDGQVAPLNRGFTPSQAEVESARRLLISYWGRVEAGGSDALTVGGVEGFEGRIIDRGEAAQAQGVIDWAQACAARDEAKAAALEQRPVPRP